MRGKIDLDYDVSPDEYERHRALYLYWPTIEMSGDYTCKISTLHNEVSETKRMTIFGKLMLYLLYAFRPRTKFNVIILLL